MSDDAPQTTDDAPPSRSDAGSDAADFVESVDAAGADAAGADAAPDADTESRENEEFAVRIRRYLDYAVLVGLLLLSLVAALQFYLNASQTITTWVTPEYRAPFQAVFNLALLLAAAFGISVEVRRITSGRD